MGWKNPPIPWSQLERALTDASRPGGAPAGAGGGDSPAWSRKRQPYLSPPEAARAADAGVVPYAELHAHSTFSFLDGASQPEKLLEEASRLGLHALALTDHDGFYGIVRMAEAAAEHRAGRPGLASGFEPVKTVFGAELSLGLSGPQTGDPDPEGDHLLVLARGEEGYHRLAAAITKAQLAGGEKGRPTYDLADLADRAGGHWLILTGCRKGAVRRALSLGIPGSSDFTFEGAYRQAGAELDRLIRLFGEQNVVVELFDHGDPLDSQFNDALYQLAHDRRMRVVATGNVHYATPEQHHLANAVAAVRARRSLDDADGWLPASGTAHLRSGREMQRLFARYPGAVENTVPIADELAFELRSAKPALPGQDVPDGHTPMSWLRELVWRGAEDLYPELDAHPEWRSRIEHELDVIERKNFPGYFLIVWDIVREARARGILCQGRGSAANSAVCYLLRITAVDAIYYGLPFERFLSSMREEEPDIDVDFESDRREQIIQYVFDKYGRERAAQVCNVIQYRPKAAVRDMAKALGHGPGQQDAWSKQVEQWGDTISSDGDHDIPANVVDLALEVMSFPRHLGIHSGGMVLTERPVGEVVPIEHARMDKRTVVQWDKDDCAWMGLVKFDLLGLGMLSAIQYTFDLVRDGLGEEWTLASIPKEEAGVYDQLCRADSVGVFQVESRAQMGLLPRLQPRRFYDLVVQIALIRPGPIQGGAVHPYVRRKLGDEPITYRHPKLVEPLERTLGIPVFQEQLMQMAMAVGDCSLEDADLLRRAMGSKRGIERIDKIKDRLYRGMARNGLVGEDADAIFASIQAFAGFGFAESHALSFGLLVYASAWLRLHYPGAFLAALLRAQPMGFYSPQTLVADAARHGVTTLRPHINRSGAWAALEPLDAPASGGVVGSASPATARNTSTREPTGSPACLHRSQPPVPPVFDPHGRFDSDDHRRDGNFAVRLGLDEVNGISGALAGKIVADRDAHGPFVDMGDLVRRVGLTTAQLELLAGAGAFDCFGLTRREAMWDAGNAAQNRAGFLEHSVVTVQPPLFAIPTEPESLVTDLWATGMSVDNHPVRHLRPQLERRGVLSALALRSAEPQRRVEVAGVVTHRQRPATASGITFVNLEDETGLINVIVSAGVWNRYRRVVREAPALVARGILERSKEGVTNLVADRFEPLALAPRTKSRDFR